MSLHRRRTHPKYVEGCFGCKLGTISVGTVPGGARDRRTGISAKNNYESDLHHYRERRRAGEQPDGTTRVAQEKYERRVANWEKSERTLKNDNPPERVESLRKATFNE